MRWVIGVVALSALGLAATARAEWVVNQDGQCVRQWTPRSLWRGPETMVDAPLVPIRFVEGGIAEAAECSADECGPTKRALLGSAGVVLGAASGSFAAFTNFLTGFGETVTGGTVEFSEPDAERFTLWPTRFVALSDVCCFVGRPRNPTVDRCGRVEFDVPPAEQWWQPPWWRSF